MIAAEPSEPGAHAWSWRLPFDPTSVRAARSKITASLRRLPVDQSTVDDARVVVSELMANALRHARPLQGGHLLVSLSVDAESVQLSVADGGSATLPVLLHPPELAPSGRGLAIVGMVTSRWGVREGASGNTVFGVLLRG